MIGFLTYGPHVAIVAYAPMDFGTRKAAASAAGFIDGMGYIGAAITGIASGFLADQFGWNAAFYLWMGGAFGAAFLMLLIWNYRPKLVEYH
jgi:OPA family glycerol-3-phosphate transporter-like MFS transporter